MVTAFVTAFLVAFAACGVPSAQDAKDYEARKAKTGRDPDAHVALALWCEERGMVVEKFRHLALAVAIAPDHARARGLLGQVEDERGWKSPDAVRRRVADDETHAANRAEYESRRARVKRTADDQWKLALWCEKNGLDAEAYAHIATVLRIDPTREAAWKRLGYQKFQGRWLTPVQIARVKAEAKVQADADKTWKPTLTKWKRWLADSEKRGDAESALANVTDPRAVPAIGLVFGAGSDRDQLRAVQLLGQIDARSASRMLAVLALFARDGNTRSAAAQTLRFRDPREFADILIAQIQRPLRYELRPVGGPGSPGILFVEGERFNRQLSYSPPPMPWIPMLPNDRLIADLDGMPILQHVTRTGTWDRTLAGKYMTLDKLRAYKPADKDEEEALRKFWAGYEPQPLARSRGTNSETQIPLTTPSRTTDRPESSINMGVQRVAWGMAEDSVLIPIGRIAMQYRFAAESAQRQLASDVQLIEAYNTDVRDLNDRAITILSGVAEGKVGDDRDSWISWWTELRGYAYYPKPQAPKPTYFVEVPPEYVPDPIVVTPIALRGNLEGIRTEVTRISCFAAGTLVQTIKGAEPIERLQVGDRVLSQDTISGRLSFQPVTLTYHNPPGKTLRINLGAEAIVSSVFHRFWCVGRGWVMARDLKEGDVIRAIHGTLRVASIEKDPVQLLYNLDVAETHSFFVGPSSVLVHDNSLPAARETAFDAARDRSASVASK